MKIAENKSRWWYRAVIRFQVSEWVHTMAGTFTVNFLGSIAIGYLMYESVSLGAFCRETRLLLGTGFIGDFTAISAFTNRSLQAGPVWGVINIIANIFFDLVGVSHRRHIIIPERRSI
jgi:CrcB protein